MERGDEAESTIVGGARSSDPPSSLFIMSCSESLFKLEEEELGKYREEEGADNSNVRHL